MTTLMIKLDPNEYEALRSSAQRDLRGAREQARFILRSSLFGESPLDNKKPVTDSNLAARTVNGSEKINP